MNDSDPRPMPPQVLAAYRDPLSLTELFASNVFTYVDRISVRDDLLERLVRRHGNVEVEIGKGNRTMPIRSRVGQFKKNAWASIDVMIAAEEFGRPDAVMLELASVMQPYWLRWWEEMRWRDMLDVKSKLRMCNYVLGDRQFTWMAAQYARSVIGAAGPSERRYCIDSISAAEAWAIDPSKENRDSAVRAANDAVSYGGGGYAVMTSRSAALATLANHIYLPDRHAYSWPYAANAVNQAVMSGNDPSDYSDNRNRLCELTKRLITPTLITHASRGLR